MSDKRALSAENQAWEETRARIRRIEQSSFRPIRRPARAGLDSPMANAVGSPHHGRGGAFEDGSKDGAEIDDEAWRAQLLDLMSAT
jgi:hypothetical protein